MQVHRPTSQFGWPGDGGLGLRLIARIRAGAKTATCCPLCLSTPDEVAETWATVGEIVTVVDHGGRAHCDIRILEVFETLWGAPDPRLVRGEEFTSADEWRASLGAVWKRELDEKGLSLHDDSPLIVELFELVPDAGDRPSVAPGA